MDAYENYDKIGQLVEEVPNNYRGIFLQLVDRMKESSYGGRPFKPEAIAAGIFYHANEGSTTREVGERFDVDASAVSKYAKSIDSLFKRKDIEEGDIVEIEWVSKSSFSAKCPVCSNIIPEGEWEGIWECDQCGSEIEEVFVFKVRNIPDRIKDQYKVCSLSKQNSE